MSTEEAKIALEQPQQNDIGIFQNVLGRTPRTVRVSSLYNLMEDLMQEQLDLINPSQITHMTTNERQAFLLSITGNPNITLFEDEGFSFVQRHLTIDKLYANAETRTGRRGFTLAHYTEEYQRDNRDKLIVHAYFNSAGQYAFCQIKRLFLNQDQVPEEEISRELTKDVIRNATPARNLLSKFLEEKARRYFKAKI